MAIVTNTSTMARAGTATGRGHAITGVRTGTGRARVTARAAASGVVFLVVLQQEPSNTNMYDEEQTSRLNIRC